MTDSFLSKIERESKLEYWSIMINDVRNLKQTEDGFVIKRGEHIYRAFKYLPKYATESFNRLPAYHITECSTMKEYSKPDSEFDFAYEMPVDIYCSDQEKDIGKQYLELCLNCKASLSLVNILSSNEAWYLAVLELAEQKSEKGYKSDWIREDQYTADWEQLSVAIRLRDGMKCQQCEQQFDERSRYFLEVHHRDGNKQNNRGENLTSLCVRCHSQVDDRHRANYQSEKGQGKLSDYEFWLTYEI